MRILFHDEVKEEPYVKHGGASLPAVSAVLSQVGGKGIEVGRAS